MKHPLYVALVWHMHQPDYRDPVTGVSSMPWVRLHAAKDYLHMAEVVSRHPGIHILFNFTPTLLEQLEEYACGSGVDRVMLLSRQETWTEEERAYILNVGFSAHWENIIRRHPLYWALLQRREAALHNLAEFSDQEYRDILAWFQLVWTDPNYLDQDVDLARLLDKGRDFTIADLSLIIDRHCAFCGRVIPLYRQLVECGQVEPMVSPYAHPILPLLIDSSHAQRATPGLTVPDPPFQAPADAAAHLQRAILCYTKAFGQRPAAIWPSEGAVSQEAIAAIDAAGFRWLASDEAVLGRCLGRWFQRDSQETITTPRALYQPYTVMVENRPGPVAIFRDHTLSDRIGFIYQHIPGEQAAEDMIVRLQIIRRRLADEERPYLVAIILDGENCWEGYAHNGDIFLHSLYRRLSQSNDLRTVTVSEYLQMNPPRGTLARIATGSWINGDLTTWIGDPEHILAWSLLRTTRAFLVDWEVAHPQAAPTARQEAWDALYSAEGSDWFWWYSARNTSDQDALFDALFRTYLAKVYRALEQEVPEQLMEPITAHGRRLDQVATQRQYLTPRLQAYLDPTREWQGALVAQAISSTGAMQGAGSGLRTLRVAYDASHLYLRLESFEALESIHLVGTVRAGEGWEARLECGPGQPAALLDGVALPTACGDRLVEMSIPFDRLGIAIGAHLAIQGHATHGDGTINRVPADRPLELILAPLEPDL
jgi:alpha-amylase/alpha-mannosidase (GH57 family)